MDQEIELAHFKINLKSMSHIYKINNNKLKN